MPKGTRYRDWNTFAVVLPINISHADLHNILLLVLVSFLIAGVLKPFGIRFFDAFLCSIPK
jgi:hypothetical protein